MPSVKTSPVFAGDVVRALDVVATAHVAIVERGQCRSNSTIFLIARSKRVELGRCIRALAGNTTLRDGWTFRDRVGLTFVERTAAAREDGASFAAQHRAPTRRLFVFDPFRH